MVRIFTRRAMLAHASLAALAAASAAHAQTAAPPAADTGASVSEVVVTASKREQRLVDVPYAVTAVGAAEITARGSLDIKDLQYSVPGLNITPGTLGQDRVALRGINAGFGTGLPVVGVYVDDVGVSVDQQQRETSFPLVDIDRIEVLRGPQGTLYGQGSEAGTIRYITRNPSLTAFDGFIEGNIYSQHEGGTGGRLNVVGGGPIVQDKLGLRLVAGYEDQAGWIDYPNARQNNANNVRTYYIRPKLLWKPTENLTVSLLYQYYDAKAATSPFTYNSTNSFNASRLDRQIDRSDLVDLTLNYTTDFGTFTSSTGYLHRDFVFQFPAPFPYTAAQNTRFEQTTEEFRFTSKQLGHFNFTTGVFYRDFASPTLRTIDTTGFPPATATALFNALTRTGTDPVNSQAFAVFGDGTYSVNDKLDLSVGVRYYTDDRQTINITPVIRYTETKASFDSVDPRFNIRYKITPDISAYFQAAKGFRSGGFNTTPQNPTYDAEDLWSYEGGVKAALFGGKLYIDSAVYYLDYSNRQSQSLVNVSGLQIASTTNGGAASGPGFEFSGTLQLPWRLKAEASVSYNDVTFDTTTIENRAGDRFALVSPWTGGASLSQRIPLSGFPIGHGDASLFWRADYQHADAASDVIRGANAAGQSVILYNGKSGTQDTVNLHAGVQVKDVSLTFEALNLSDNRAVVYPFLGYGPGYNQRLRPRSLGVTLRYDFR